MWKFIKSSSNIHNWLDHEKNEICFIGRSNVGKSGLINALANNKKLAKTSKTPGRTQLINYFEINDKIIAVDLPGYGYAKMPIKQKQKMIVMVDEYLTKSLNLKIVFLLFDANVGFTKQDIEIIKYIKGINKKIVLIGTKIDKLNQSKLHHLKQEELIKTNKYFLISSFSKKNIGSLNDFILENNY